ncbi:MAG: outer membrane lipoprotein-sorting protein [Gammaproteobacteria bacterium]|jgi:hypothetical protein|nr:outer membrane lipoprotein-sorting protein [Gammaproteobacteria bacterium]
MSIATPCVSPRSSLRRWLAPLCALLFAAAAEADGDAGYQALRDWLAAGDPPTEGLTAGQHFGAKDRAQLEAYIPRTAWTYYFFDDMDMEVAAPGDYPPPPTWGKAVKAGYTLDDRGVLKGFTGGGYPFPEVTPDDPQAAYKVIWNMLWRPGQNDYDMPMVTWLRGEGGKLDRKLEYMAVNSTYAKGDECLVPGYEEVKSKRIMEFRSPRDMAGAKDMLVSFVDHDREDSGWLYMPAQRKPRRTLASERTSELMGMDMIREDMDGFGGKVHENNWTYLGTRNVVATINVADNPEFGGPHLWVPNKARWEVRKAHVLLIEPKAKDHPYSHRVVFIDAENFWTLWMFAFDKADDQLLRMQQHFLKYTESYDDEPPQQAPYISQDWNKSVGHHVLMHLGETDINAKKPHATMSHCYTNKRVFSSARARQYYSLRNMISGRR